MKLVRLIPIQVLLFFSTVSPIFANEKIDSLKQLLNNNLNDSVKADILIHIGFEQVYSYPKESMKNYYQALTISRKNSIKLTEIKCLNALAALCHLSNNVDSAIFFYNQTINIYKELHDTLGIGKMYNNIGGLIPESNYEKKFEYYQKALPIIKKYNEKDLADILYNIGQVYYTKGEYAMAIDYFYQAQDLFVKYNHTSDPSVKSIIGSCYFNINLSENALHYFNEALKDYIKSENRTMEYNVYTKIFDVYLKKGLYDSALIFLNKTLLFKQEPFYSEFYGSINFSSYYLALNQPDKAYEYILSAEKASEKNINLNGKYLFALNKSKYYIAKNMPDKGLNILLNYNEDSLPNTDTKFSWHEQLSKAYLLNNNTTEAYEHLKKAIQWKDSLNIQNNRQIVIEKDLIHKFEKEKQEQEAIQNQKNLKTELALLQKKKLNWLLWLIISFIMIITVIISFILRQKKNDNKTLQKQKEDIHQKEELATTLFKELNHRVKNNLQMVSSLFNIQYHSSDDYNVKEALTKASGRINSLIILHQHMYKVDYALIPGTQEYLNDLCEKIIAAAGVEDKVLLKIQIENINSNISELTHLGLIINEMLTNAIKYGVDLKRKDNKIEISFLREKDFYTLSVFNTTYKDLKSDSTINSSSLFGLSLIETIASQYQGEINADFVKNGKVSVKLFL